MVINVMYRTTSYENWNNLIENLWNGCYGTTELDRVKTCLICCGPVRNPVHNIDEYNRPVYVSLATRM